MTLKVQSKTDPTWPVEFIACPQAGEHKTSGLQSFLLKHVFSILHRSRLIAYRACPRIYVPSTHSLSIASLPTHIHLHFPLCFFYPHTFCISRVPLPHSHPKCAISILAILARQPLSFFSIATRLLMIQATVVLHVHHFFFFLVYLCIYTFVPAFGSNLTVRGLISG